MGDRRSADKESGLKSRRPAVGEKQGSILPVRLLFLLLALAGIGYWQLRDVIEDSFFSEADKNENRVLVTRPFHLCAEGALNQCVIDPGNIVYDGKSLRIVDVYAPRNVGAECDKERQLAKDGAEALVSVLNGGPFELTVDTRPPDAQGRRYATLKRDGVSIGGIIVGKGFARSWTGAIGGWCD